MIDKKIFFDQLIKLKNNMINELNEQKRIKFNILNIYPHNDLGTIMSGYLTSGFLEINKPIYWITKSNVIDCKIKSIHINCEPVNKCETSHMLTVCVSPTKSTNVKKLKNGILSNKILTNKSKISFQFLNFSGARLLNNLAGYCANRLVNLTNITEKEGEYICVVDNYYNDDKIIIIDTDTIKGICLIS
jgi:hypothetical protein